MTWLRSELVRMLKYGIVGSVTTLASYVVFAGLLRVGWHYALATLAGSTFGMALGFRLHGRFVFGNPGKGRFLRFALSFMTLYGLSIGLQWLARMVVNGYAAGALAAAIIIPSSFLVNRNYVFHLPLNRTPGS